MNIKVAALTVSEKSSNTLELCLFQHTKDKRWKTQKKYYTFGQVRKKVHQSQMQCFQVKSHFNERKCTFLVVIFTKALPIVSDQSLYFAHYARQIVQRYDKKYNGHSTKMHAA